MNRHDLTRTLACLALAGTFGPGATRASGETEPRNNSSATANVIALDFKSGGTASGKLRKNNTTPTPRDVDFFKITNVHDFTSIDIVLSANPDGAQHLSYEVLTTGLTPVLPDGPFSLGGSPQTQTLTAASPGATFFIKVFDDGNLTTASGDADYTIKVTGTGGVNPLDRYLAHLAECKKLQTQHNAAVKLAAKSHKSADRVKAEKLGKKLSACKKELARLKALI